MNGLSRKIDDLSETVDKLAVIMMTGFEKQGAQIDSLEQNLNDFKENTGQQFHGINQRFETVEYIISDFKKETTENFNKVDQRFEEIDRRFDLSDERFNTIEYTMKGIDRKISTDFVRRDELAKYLLV